VSSGIRDINFLLSNFEKPLMELYKLSNWVLTLLNSFSLAAKSSLGIMPLLVFLKIEFREFSNFVKMPSISEVLAIFLKSPYNCFKAFCRFWALPCSSTT
jgi:hypothetical protein